MKTLVCVLLHALRSCFRTRLGLQAENLALRHQITVLQRGRKRLVCRQNAVGKQIQAVKPSAGVDSYAINTVP